MKLLRTFAVSPATVLSFLIVPFALGIFYFVSIYTDRYVNQSGNTFFDIQSNFFNSIFLEQKWIGWFNRFMDFAIWGVIAAAIVIIGWMFSAARVAVKNHYAEESFRNFKVPKGSWHSQFFVVAIIKVLLVLGILYCTFVFIGQAVPLLAVGIGNILRGFNWNDAWQIVYTVLLMMFLQYIIIICLKLFRTTHTD